MVLRIVGRRRSLGVKALLLGKRHCAEVLRGELLLRMAPVHMGIASAERHWRLECGIWRIVEILGLLAHAVLTLIMEAALDTPLTRPFVA